MRYRNIASCFQCRQKSIAGRSLWHEFAGAYLKFKKSKEFDFIIKNKFNLLYWITVSRFFF